MVNIPEYTLRVFKNGAQVWKTRIVIGKPDKQTPMLTASMKYITVNPTWNVPPSIVQNEYLPALAQDPTVLARMGLKVEHNRDGSIHISQPPGDGNALGRVRFNFPNKFLVYQHDTPDKHLFAQDAPRLQPRLHARAGPAEIRGSAAQHRAAERGLDGREDQADVWARRAGHLSSRRRSRSTSPIRPRSSTIGQAAIPHRTSTVSTPHDRGDQDTSAA